MMKKSLYLFTLFTIFLFACKKEEVKPKTFDVPPNTTAVNLEVGGIPFKASAASPEWLHSVYRSLTMDSAGVYYAPNFYKSSGEFGGTYQQATFYMKTSYLPITDKQNPDKDYNFGSIWQHFSLGLQPIMPRLGINNHLFNTYEIQCFVIDETGKTQNFSANILATSPYEKTNKLEIVKIKGIDTNRFCVTYEIDCAIECRHCPQSSNNRMIGTIQVVYSYYPFKW